MTQLNGKKILLLVANGAEESAMSAVQREVLKAGATYKTVAVENGLVNSWNNGTWGLYFPVDQPIGQTLGADFDCLVVPSGARGVMKLAGNPHTERIIASFVTAQKPMCFMGDAVTLLEKIGLSAQMKNEKVMTGDCADVAVFVQTMISHFAGADETIKVAA